MDVENDYRPSGDVGIYDGPGNELMAEMQAFEYLQIRDGLSNIWTRSFYNYERQPSCPLCGNSENLYCDKTIDPRRPRGVCVTKTHMFCRIPRSPINSSRVAEANQWMPPEATEFRHRALLGDGRHQDRLNFSKCFFCRHMIFLCTT